MADDQNQQGQQSNTARIQGMLDELARARAAAKSAVSADADKAQQARQTPSPSNLPTRQGTVPAAQQPQKPVPTPPPPPQQRPAPQPTPPPRPTPPPPKPAPQPQQQRPAPPPQPTPPPRSIQPPKPAPTAPPPAVPRPSRPTPPPQPPKPAPPVPAPKPTPLAPKPPQPKPASTPPPLSKPAPPAPREAIPPPTSKPPTPAAPPKPVQQAPVTAELRTMQGDIGQIQVGKAPEGTRAAPSPVPTPQAPLSAQEVAPSRITVPKEKAGQKRGKTLLFAGFGLIGVVLVIFILAALLNGNGGTEPTPTPTPTPSASLTPAPSVTTLSDYFGDPQITVSVENLSAFFTTAEPAEEQAVPFAVTRADGRATQPNELLVALFAHVPQDVEAAFIGSSDAESVLLAYGQTELFDDIGQPQANAQDIRPVLVLEIADASTVNQRMQTWEDAGMAQNAIDPFAVDTTKAIVPGFIEGTYRQIPIRYWNFPYADDSLDWSIVLASNGKNYLVISGSRQSAFFAIDRLLQ